MALGLAVNSILGPLLLDAIAYPLTETLLNQAIGLEVASLFVAAPLALLAAVLHWRGNPVGPLAGIALGAYTAYMAVQYLAGPEYLVYAHAFPFHLLLFIVGVAVAMGSWVALGDAPLPFPSPLVRRALLGVVLAAAGFVVLRYLPALMGAVTEEPLADEYAEQPTMFWTIVLMDVGLFVPASVATATGIIGRCAWAPAAAYALAGWFALVTVAVASMSLVMFANADPYASGTQVVLFVAMAAVVIALVTWLFAPLLRSLRRARAEPRQAHQ